MFKRLEFRMALLNLSRRKWQKREEAVKKLCRIKDPRAVKPLLKALDDDTWNVRSAAAEALGQLNDKSAVEPLIKALRENRDLRATAAEALGKLKDLRAVEPLLNAICDPEENVRKIIEKALNDLGETKTTIYGHLYDYLIKAQKEKEIKKIISMLYYPDIYSDAVKALIELSDADTIRILRDELFKNHNEKCIDVLAEIASDEAIAVLLHGLNTSFYKLKIADVLRTIYGRLNAGSRQLIKTFEGTVLDHRDEPHNDYSSGGEHTDVDDTSGGTLCTSTICYAHDDYTTGPDHTDYEHKDESKRFTLY